MSGECTLDNHPPATQNRLEASENMQVTVEVPDQLAEQIRKSSGDIGRRLLEAYAVEASRSQSLTGWQVQQLLGFKSRFELDAFLKRAGVEREYTPEELEVDYQASRRASREHAKNK